MVKTWSLYLNWSWNGTDVDISKKLTAKHTDRITTANTRYS